jgi:hypothetical protein
MNLVQTEKKVEKTKTVQKWSHVANGEEWIGVVEFKVKKTRS